MARFLKNDISEECCEQIAEGNSRILTENLDQLRCESFQRHSSEVAIHHQSLELVYFRIIAIHLSQCRNIVCFTVDSLDNTEVIDIKKLTVGENAVAKREEIILAVPAELPHTLRRVRPGVEVAFYSVEFVYLGKPYEIAEGTGLLLECGKRTHFRLSDLHLPCIAILIYKFEKAGAVVVIADVEQRLHDEIGDYHGVFLLAPYCVVTVVSDEEPGFTEVFDFLLLLIGGSI